MLEKAVERIFERATDYKDFAKCKDRQMKRGMQMLISKDDIPLLIEAYNNKKISIREYPVGRTKDYNDGWFIQRNVIHPVCLRDDRLYFGDDLWVDADKLLITTTIGLDKTTPGQEKQVCGLQLQAWQTFGEFNGKDVTPENTKYYMFNRVICEVKELKEFAGNKYENYFVAADGLVFTNKSSGKEHLTPLVASIGKSNKKDGKGTPYYHVVLVDTSGKPHPLNIHKLVAVLFIENDDPLNKTDVNHRDLNPCNNAMENLEWCTKAYNSQYTYTFRALKEAMPEIDCHLWLDDCHDLTEKVLNLKSEDKTKLTAAAAVQISKRLEHNHLAAAS